MKTAVVILNWNGADMLRRFLPSVVRYSDDGDTAVYVADNGSTDDSVSLLQADFPTVRLVLLDRNYGFAEGYNKALAQVDAEYVVLLNSDVEVTEGWLAPLTGYLDSHAEATACQPTIRSWHQRDKFEYAGAAGGFIDRFGYPFCRGRVMQTVEADTGQYPDTIPVFWATGAALCIRRKDYVEAGGLDARFFAHMEEIDLCWRLQSRGRAIACVPQSVVYHVGAATLKRENPRKTYLNFRNNLLMLFKNLPQGELKTVLRIRSVLDVVAALSFCCKGEFANARSVFRAQRDFRRMRKEYAEVRTQNLQKAVASDIPGRVRFSLLWRYYARQQKTYNQLFKNS